MTSANSSSPLAPIIAANGLLWCLALACSEPEYYRGFPPLPEPEYVAVDGAAAWSPSDSLIAYSRSYPSSAGPPGIYIIRSDGTGNRLLLAGGGGTMDFSPRGTVIAVGGGDIFLLDVTSGDRRQLTATEEIEATVDWSPDGRSIVTTGPSVRDQGLRVVDAATGAVRAINHGLDHVYGAYARWSPSGEWIAFAASANDGNRNVFLVAPDGSVLRRLTDSAGKRGYADDPRWLNGGEQVLYNWRGRNSPSHGSRVVYTDGTGDSPWPLYVNYWDAISSDSRFVITIAVQPGDERISELPVGVLFIRDVDDAAGVTMRQLTTYSPAGAPRHER